MGTLPFVVQERVMYTPLPSYQELTCSTQSRHAEPLNGFFQEEPEMAKVRPAHFSPELVARMRAALDTAVEQIAHSHRTPATKAKMAERIVRMASEGVRTYMS
jgi:hypothetical protein